MGDYPQYAWLNKIEALTERLGPSQIVIVLLALTSQDTMTSVAVRKQLCQQPYEFGKVPQVSDETTALGNISTAAL